MRKDLGLSDDNELNTWFEGPRFGVFFQEYAKEWINPQEEYVRETGGVRPRGPNLQTVEERLIAGERPGHNKSHIHNRIKEAGTMLTTRPSYFKISVVQIPNQCGACSSKRVSPNRTSITEYGYS